MNIRVNCQLLDIQRNTSWQSSTGKERLLLTIPPTKFHDRAVALEIWSEGELTVSQASEQSSITLEQSSCRNQSERKPTLNLVHSWKSKAAEFEESGASLAQYLVGIPERS